jgi:hypothetical protein
MMPSNVLIYATTNLANIVLKVVNSTQNLTVLFVVTLLHAV